MAVRPPINATLFDPQMDIKTNGWLPVSSHQIYEASSTMFHPEGLFSEVIFGQVGSSKRMSTFGYIDLQTRVFQPKIYKTIVSLKALYEEIMAGKTFALLDPETKDFIRCESDTIGAGTGFAFFVENFPKLQFSKTNSLRRLNKIELLEKYQDILLMKQCLVSPAGIRDIRVERDGQTSSEEINKLYLGLMSLCQALPGAMGESPLFDSLRYNIQLRVMQIYNYLQEIVDGKHGFMLGKYTARSVALGTRNVITAPNLSEVKSPNDPKCLKSDEVLIPLFQVAKSLAPAMVHSIKTNFFDLIFASGTGGCSLIDPEDMALKYTTVEDTEKMIFTSGKGIEKLLNLFRNEFIRHKAVTLKDNTGKNFYCYLVYDTGDTVYMLRDKESFRQTLEGTNQWTTSKVKHLELLETYGIPRSECMLLGSAALLAYGYPTVNNDLDIVVTKDKLKQLIEKHGFIEQDTPFGWKTYKDPTESIEVSGRTFFDGKLSTNLVDGCHVASLQLCYDSYAELNRSQDRYKLAWLDARIFKPEYLRPLTYAELFYVAAYKVVALSNVPKHATVTRYPILNMYGLLPSRINIQTTEPNRTVTFRHPTNQDLSVVLPRYPILNGSFQDSMSVHPSSLSRETGYDGDHDGDALTANSLLSNEANSEIITYYQRPNSMVSPMGGLIRGLKHCKLGQYVAHVATREPE